MTRHDIVVAGGGPAGAALAIDLARAGTDVLLLERRSGPHDKVCGEFVSAGALRSLHDLGVDPAFLGAVPVTRLCLSAGRKLVEAALPFPALGLSRRALDAALLERAGAAGAAVRCGVAVRGIRPGLGGLVVRTEVGEVGAARVALATGKHELRGLRRRTARDAEPWIGLKLHLRAARPLDGRIEVAVFEDGYAGLQQVEGGRVNLCLAGRGRAVAEAAGDAGRLRDLLALRAPRLSALLDGAEPCRDRPLAVSGVPYGWLHPTRRGAPGLLRIGDQFGVIPSFCGDGIAIALHTGRAAARAVLRREEPAALHRRLRRDLARQFRLAALLGAGAGSGAARTAFLAVARLWPGLLPMIASLTRIPARRSL